MRTRIETTDLARDALYTKVNQIADEKIDLDSLCTNTDLRNSIHFYGWKGGTISSSTFVPTANANYYTTNLNLSVGDKFFSDASPIEYLGIIISVEESSEVSGVYIVELNDGNEYTLKYNSGAGGTTISSFDFLVPSQRAVRDYVDNNFVTLGTAQTITGAKTFSSQIIAGTGNGIQIKGTNHYYVLRSSGSPYEGCSLFLDNDTSKAAFNVGTNKITIGSASIPAHAVVPTETTSGSGTQIATTGWVNSTGNNVIHKSGNETIGGTKTFSSTIAGSINGNAATVTNGVYTTGKQTIGGTKTFSAVAYGKSSDAANSFVTTIDKTKASKGHFWLGNGMLINWGKITATNNNMQTVSFDKAYSAIPCIFFAYNRTDDTQYSSMANCFDIFAQNTSTTGFKWQNRNIGNDVSGVWFAIGYRNS